MRLLPRSSFFTPSGRPSQFENQISVSRTTSTGGA